MVKQCCLLFVILSNIFITSYGYTESSDNIEQNIAEINALFLLENDLLPYEEVIEISQKIIKKRELYSANTIAKMFDLLASVATNKGDLVKAMQFALDGEDLLGIEPAIQLSLLLKIAAGHYSKGKYHQAKAVTIRAVNLAESNKDPKQLIKALSYRAMTNALIAEHELALKDLQQVNQLLSEHQEFNDHVVLLDGLASAYYYLGSYQTAVELYNKTLKIRFDLSNENNVEQTYYNLARSYLKLNQLDDAYNAFWEAKKHAEVKNAPIRIGYAQLGLGQVLFQQKQYQQALRLLEQSEQNFHGQSLSQPHLSTLLTLAKVTKSLGNINESYFYLEQAKKVLENTELMMEQIEFYLLQAEMYQDKKQYQKAAQSFKRYIELYAYFNKFHQPTINAKDSNALASEQSKAMSLKMADETDLKNQYTKKFHYQNQLIITLVMLIALFIIVFLYLAYRIRVQRLNQQYDEIEKPIDYIANPSQTKSFYQHHFKMARKYNYKLTVGYFSIDNWQELEFQFSKKMINEVIKTVAILINEHCEEFDQVGLINNGEYLFLSPYQTNEHLRNIFEQITRALKVQFFANLGEFSLKVSYDCQSPCIQDIDPYIFLSRLSESTRAEYSSYKK